MRGKLYIVATPIGNLGDITMRAVETLRNADFVLCEDTRVTKNLLGHFRISRPLISYHQHSDAKKVNEIASLLAEGKNLALVTDAGTPGISDPGNLLIRDLASKDSQTDVIPVPGASAAIAALSISGFPTDKYIFMGFPPHKNKRQKFFREVAGSGYTVVFYESSHRILKCLSELKEVLTPATRIVVCRELTKKFESVYRGAIDQILKMNIPEKGEFVVVVSHQL